MADIPGMHVTKSARITGRELDRIGLHLRDRYERGASIRDLVLMTDRSYGWVREMLVEAGVELRGRGGDHKSRGRPT